MATMNDELPSIDPKAAISQKTRPSLTIRLQKHFTTAVNPKYADIPLLFCCLISGLVDSTIYNAYGTFVSMQTGNTIFVGLGGSTSHRTTKPYGWAKSLMSIVCFCLGCFFLSRLSRSLGPAKRGTLAFSFLIQSIFIFVAAGVVQGGFVEGHLRLIPGEIDWRQLLPICFLSFQSAGQIVGSRALNYSEIPTIVVTSMLHDITSDPELFKGLHGHAKRNRRVVAFFAILIGAVAGGFIGGHTDQMQIPLWIAGALKVCIAVSWTVWPPRPEPATV